MSYQSPLPPEQTQQQHATKRPWLPMRHVIGLALVLVFIVGSLGASWVGLGNVDWAEQGPAEEDPRGYKGDMMDDMSIAMLLDDREQFVKWGEGAVKEQLGQIWDESKKLGWKVGFVSGVRSEEDDKREELRRLEKDLSFHYPIGLAISFDLGVSQKRIDGESDAECSDTGFGCGMLTHAFEYDLEVLDDEDDRGLHRITTLTPRKPMPWDSEEGVHAVRQENVVLFGYASEAARLDEVAGEVQRAAAAVLDTPLTSAPYSEIEGFPAFYSDDPQRYGDATIGTEGDSSPHRDWVESGLTLAQPLGSPPFNIEKLVPGLQIMHGMGETGMALIGLNGQEISDVFSTAAHEFAHGFDVSTFTHFFSSGSEESSQNFGREGLATFVEGYVVEAAGGQARTMTPEIRSLIASTPDHEMTKLIDFEAFSRGETAGTAYAVAGNYYAFMAAGDVDLIQVMKSGEYLMFDPDVWVMMHYPPTTSGGTMDATYAAWRAWNAS